MNLFFAGVYWSSKWRHFWGIFGFLGQFLCFDVFSNKSFNYTPVIKHSNGKSPFSIGNTSSKGPFPIAMLDYRSVLGFWWFSEIRTTPVEFFVIYLTQVQEGVQSSVPSLPKSPSHTLWGSVFGTPKSIFRRCECESKHRSSQGMTGRLGSMISWLIYSPDLTVDSQPGTDKLLLVSYEDFFRKKAGPEIPPFYHVC